VTGTRIRCPSQLLLILERLDALEMCGPEVPSTELLAMTPAKAAGAAAKAFDQLSERWLNC